MVKPSVCMAGVLSSSPSRRTELYLIGFVECGRVVVEEPYVCSILYTCTDLKDGSTDYTKTVIRTLQRR
jgi:hypothetical protein